MSGHKEECFLLDQEGYGKIWSLGECKVTVIMIKRVSVVVICRKRWRNWVLDSRRKVKVEVLGSDCERVFCKEGNVKVEMFIYLVSLWISRTFKKFVVK